MTASHRSRTRRLAVSASAFALALSLAVGNAAPAVAQTGAQATVPTAGDPRTEPHPETAPATDPAIAPSSATVEPQGVTRAKPGVLPTQGGVPTVGDVPAPAETRSAQDNPSAAGVTSPDAAPGQDVLVVGTRASLQSAINRKRNAGTIVDSIVADDIASFPDKNVGDSLSRITGVQLSRDFGEGTQVSIRGVEPDLNRVEINGVSQVSALGTRAGDFRELATELVKSIDVYKGYSADLTEGGIGGTVSIETRKPLELRQALGSVVFSEQHLDTSQDWRPRATVVLGTPHLFLKGLGALLNVTYDDVTTRQDYASNTNYNRLADFDRSDQKTVANPTYANYGTFASCSGLTAAAARLACQTQFFDWAPTVPRYRNLVRRDKRLSGDLTVQYEVAHNFRVYGEAQVNNRDQRLFDTNYSLDMGRAQRFQLDNPTVPLVTAGTSTVDANHVVTSFTTATGAVNIGTAAAPVYSGSSNILSVQRRDFDYNQKSQYYQGGFEWNLDRVEVKGLASYANASTVGNTNLIQLTTGIAGVTVDDRNPLGIPVFTYPSSVNPADPSIYTDYNRARPVAPGGPVVQFRPSLARNTEKQLKLDVDYHVDFGPLKTIEYGGQFRDQFYISYMGGGSRLLSAPGVNPLVYQTSANVSYTTNLVNAATVPQRVNGTTYNLTRGEYASLLGALGTVTGGAPLYTGLQNAPDTIPSRLAFANFDPSVIGQYYDLSGFNQSLVLNANGLSQIPQYKITETIAAGYLKGDVETRVLGLRLTGNFGARYIFTKDQGVGTNVSRLTSFSATGTTQTVVLSAQQLAIDNQYVDILPAFNAALEFTPNLVLRANYAKNLARPKPTDLVPNINCLDDATIAAADGACTAGNPELKPYRADQWELNLSWYPNRDTLVSLGYYKKYESSFVIQNVTRAGVDLFHDGTTYTVRQPVNGFGALLDGIEANAQTAFTFLPGILKGFGASANFTYARAIRTNLTNSATGAPLLEYPGLSTYTYNASAYYDRGVLNARLSYNYRSDWLVTVADALNGNLPVYRQGEGYLDGKITFRFPQYHVSVFAEMQNINRAYSRSYIKGIGTSEVYYPGQRAFVGIQAKF